MQSSYYRFIEAGLFPLHVNKTSDIARAFENRLSIIGLIHLLGITAITESYIKNQKEKTTNYEYVKLFLFKMDEIIDNSLDEKLRFLKQKLLETKILEMLKNEDDDNLVKEEIINSNFFKVVLSFISIDTYENFGKSDPVTKTIDTINSIKKEILNLSKKTGWFERRASGNEMK